MLNGLVISLKQYSVDALKASENIEIYQDNPSFGRNIKARITFLAMILISLRDALIGVGVFGIVGILSIATLCQIKSINKINFLILKINLQNIEVIASSILGCFIHPKIGIKYLNEGFQKIEYLNL